MNTGDGIESSSSRDLAGLQNPGVMAGFLEIAFDAVVEFDSQERIISWNPAAEQMFGWTAQEVRGKTPARLFWPVSTPEEKKNRRQRQSRLKRGETLRDEHTSCRKDGSSLDVQYTARALFDAAGKLTGYLAIYRDVSVHGQYITEHKQKEESLRARTEEIETLLEVSPVAIFVAHDPECVRISGNPAGYRLVGLPENPELNISKSAPAQERPTYRTFRDGVEVPVQDLPMQKAARLGAEVSEDALELRFEDGSQKFLYAFARPLFDAQGRSRGAIAAMLDITQHKRLQAETESMAKFPQENPNPVLRVSQEGVVLFGNRASQKLLDQWDCSIGMPIPELWREKVTERFRLGVPGEAMLEWNGRIFLLQLVPILENHYLNIYGRDITEHKRVEEQRERSNQKLNEILASIQDDLYVLDRDWVFVYANRLFTSRVGKEPEDFVGNNIWTMFPKHLGTVVEENFRAAMEKREIRRFETRGKYTSAWYRLTVFPSAEGITVLGTDISARKRAEEALYKSKKQLQLLNETLEQQVQEKTAEVRSLASDLVKAVQHERHRISHILHDDLQQRIYAIRMQLTFLHDELQKEDDEAARTEVANIEKELADVLTITRNLSIDLSPPILRGEGLSHAINWLAAQMRQRYGLPIELQANEPFAISAEELHVLLFNCVRELLFNVVKHAQASRAVVALHWTDAGLRIEVRDDGKGFLVNMPVQQGISEMGEEGDLQSSSGLPTIRHQLSLFDGRMEIQSTPGAGTRIILIVPVAEGE